MSTLMAAPELKVKINGAVAGYATGLNYRVTQGQKRIYGVDSPHPQEIAQGAGESYVSGSMTVFRPKGSSPETWGIMTPRTSSDGQAENGFVASAVTETGAEGAVGETALGSNKYSVLEIFDRETDKLLIKIVDVAFGEQSWSVSARQIMQGSVSFEGRAVVHTSGSPISGAFF